MSQVLLDFAARACNPCSCWRVCSKRGSPPNPACAEKGDGNNLAEVSRPSVPFLRKSTMGSRTWGINSLLELLWPETHIQRPATPCWDCSWRVQWVPTSRFCGCLKQDCYSSSHWHPTSGPGHTHCTGLKRQIELMKKNTKPAENKTGSKGRSFIQNKTAAIVI